jgi:hypothetical protein
MSKVSELLNSTACFVTSIVPKEYNNALITGDRYEQVVAGSQVRARGWPLPYYKRAELTIGPREAYCTSETEALTSVNHVEEWRLFSSGQFIFRMKLWEAGDTELQERMRKNMRHSDLSEKQLATLGGFVSFIALIYSVSEAYVFASRLAQAIPYEMPIEIQVGLRGVRNWALASNDFAVDLYNAYVAGIDAPEYATVVAIDALVASPLALATTAIQSLFRQFSWPDASADVIANWQRQLFEGNR